MNTRTYKVYSSPVEKIDKVKIVEFTDIKNAFRFAIQMEDSDDYVHEIVAIFKGEEKLIATI